MLCAIMVLGGGALNRPYSTRLHLVLYGYLDHAPLVPLLHAQHYNMPSVLLLIQIANFETTILTRYAILIYIEVSCLCNCESGHGNYCRNNQQINYLPSLSMILIDARVVVTAIFIPDGVTSMIPS